jgi:hypothetical protein
MANLNQISTHEDAPPPVEGTPEHEQAMVELAESVSAVEREDGKPTWLPDKFQSPEDMAQAYRALEQKLSSNSESVTSNDEGTQPPQTPSSDQQEQINEAQKTLANAGLDYNKFASEYLEKGGLSPESYTELQGKGMSTEMVDSWIQGQEAISDKLSETAYESVGGEKNYQDLVKWAGDSLPQNEIDAFNRALESSNNQDSLFAIKSLNAQYQLANGSTPNLIQGTTGTSSSGSFTSLAQMSEAMNDPKYKNDPAFREEVSRKLAASNLM